MKTKVRREKLVKRHKSRKPSISVDDVQDSTISSTTDYSTAQVPDVLDIAQLGATHCQHSVMLVATLSGRWFEEYDKICSATRSSDDDGSVSIAKAAKAYAQKLTDEEVNLYNSKNTGHRRSNNSSAWLTTVASDGTLGDRLAALTLLVQESPVHHLSQLESLVGAVTKKGRREIHLALGVLKQLFTESLLPDRKLVSFDERPFDQLKTTCNGAKDAIDRALILWYWEGALKQQYRIYVESLERLTHDNVENTRSEAINAIFDLLCEKPEQEQALLSYLVNKLGDTKYKIAARVSYILAKLVDRHPAMKLVVVREVERLIYRPNIAQRAQYYALCFLAGLKLARSDGTELVVKLIDIYFGLFRLLVQRGDVDNRMLGLLLTGTNRAFPFAKDRVEKLLKETDTLYRIVGIAKFHTSIQALTLLFQVLDSGSGLNDRFYSSLFRKLLDPHLLQSSQSGSPSLLFNLLFKALKADLADDRVRAILKRLFQLCAFQKPPFVSGALMLTSKLMVERPQLLQTEQDCRRKDSQRRKDSATNDDRRHRNLSNVGSGLPNEDNSTRVAENDSDGDDDDDDEHFMDVPDPDSENEPSENDIEQNRTGQAISKRERLRGSSAKGKLHSWVHRDFTNVKSATSYDPYARNPAYAGVSHSIEYDLLPLCRHYHPTVALFAKHILERKAIEYTGGDPLHDFTQIRFLDRFVYRNPKKTKSGRGTESETKKKATEGSSASQKRKSYDPWSVHQISVISNEYAAKRDEEIPVDEEFLHKYISSVARPQRLEDESDIESVASDEFEAVLEKFEPGGKNDLFDIDFSREFSSKGKTRKKKRKRQIPSNGEDSDADDNLNDDDDEEEETSMKSNRRKKRKRLIDAEPEKFTEILENGRQKGKDRHWIDKQDKLHSKPFRKGRNKRFHKVGHKRKVNR